MKFDDFETIFGILMLAVLGVIIGGMYFLFLFVRNLFSGSVSPAETKYFVKSLVCPKCSADLSSFQKEGSFKLLFNNIKDTFFTCKFCGVSLKLESKIDGQSVSINGERRNV